MHVAWGGAYLLHLTAFTDPGHRALINKITLQVLSSGRREMRTSKRVPGLVLLLTFLFPALLPGTTASWLKGLLTSRSSSEGSEEKLRQTTDEGRGNLGAPIVPESEEAGNILRPRKGVVKQLGVPYDGFTPNDPPDNEEIARVHHGKGNTKEERKEEGQGQGPGTNEAEDDLGDADWVRIENYLGEEEDVTGSSHDLHHQRPPGAPESLPSASFKILGEATDKVKDKSGKGDVTAADGATATVPFSVPPRQPGLNIQILDDYDETYRERHHQAPPPLIGDNKTDRRDRYQDMTFSRSGSPNDQEGDISTSGYISRNEEGQGPLSPERPPRREGIQRPTLYKGEEGSEVEDEDKDEIDTASTSRDPLSSFNNRQPQDQRDPTDYSPSLIKVSSCPELRELRTDYKDIPLSYFVALVQSWDQPEGRSEQGRGENESESGGERDSDEKTEGSEQDDDIDYEDLVEAMRGLQMANEVSTDESIETEFSPLTEGDHDPYDYSNTDDGSSDSESSNHGLSPPHKGSTSQRRPFESRERATMGITESSPSPDDVGDSGERSLETISDFSSSVNAAIKSLQHFGEQSAEEEITSSPAAASATTSTTDDPYGSLIHALEGINLRGEANPGLQDQSTASQTSFSTEESTEESSLSPRTAKKLLPPDLLGELEISSPPEENNPKGIIPLAPRPQRLYQPSLLKDLNDMEYRPPGSQSGNPQEASTIKSGEGLSSSTHPPQPQYQEWESRAWYEPGLNSSNHYPPLHTAGKPLSGEQPPIISPELWEILEEQCGNLEKNLQCDLVPLFTEDRKGSQESTPGRPIRGIQLLPSEDEDSETETGPPIDKVIRDHTSPPDDDQGSGKDTVSGFIPVPIPTSSSVRDVPPSYFKDEDGLLRNDNGDVIIEIHDNDDRGVTSIDDGMVPILDNTSSNAETTNDPLEFSTSDSPSLNVPMNRGPTAIPGPLSWALTGHRFSSLLARGVLGGMFFHPPWTPTMQLAYCCLYQKLVVNGLAPRAESTPSPPQSSNETNGEASSSSSSSQESNPTLDDVD